MMHDYQREFIHLAIQQKALLFGEFTLKSGRISPYFFNMGCFNTGAAIAAIGKFYAQAILHAALPFDVLFGPAYKGVPLVTTTAIALAERGIDKPYAFNRKEIKSYGEGGWVIGAPLHGRVLMVDDVISAGNTVREVIGIMEIAKAHLAGIVIALDRQERGQQGELSALQEVQRTYQIPVISIVCLDHILEYLQEIGDESSSRRILDYRSLYGVV